MLIAVLVVCSIHQAALSLTKSQLRAFVRVEVLRQKPTTELKKLQQEAFDSIATYELHRIQALNAAGFGTLIVADPIQCFSSKSTAARNKLREAAIKHVEQNRSDADFNKLRYGACLSL